MALAPLPLEGATPGVSNEEILLGTHAPLTGPAAAYGALAKAAQAYFAHVNERGGVHGRRIRLVIRDDRFRAADAERAVYELVTRRRVLAILGGFGDGPHAPVADYLNREEVPDLFPTGGTPSWSDPPRSWTIAFQPTYRQEGAALAAIARRRFAGKRIAVFAVAGELGREGAAGFREKLQGAARVVREVTHPIAAGDLSPSLETLRGSRAEVVVLFAPPRMAGRFIAAAHRADWRPAFLVGSVAAVPALISTAGRDAAEGAIGLTFLPIPEGPETRRLRRHREILRLHAPELKPGRITLYGQALAEVAVEVLTRAGPFPTRPGLISAAESLDGWTGDGQAIVRGVTLGPEDHLALQSLREVIVKQGKWTAGKIWIDVR